MTNIFEKNPKKTLLVIFILLSLMAVALLEYLAAALFGLGKVVVYDSHPIYGYRPTPAQTVSRDHGKTTVHINNLGLRANQDWGHKKSEQKRVLFLGDSVTYGGSYIDNTELFSSLVFKNHKNIVTANAGVNGWGILNIHGLIKNLDFRPADIYITVVPEGDFYRGLNGIGGQPFWTHPPRLALEELLQHFIYVLSLKKNGALNINGLSSIDQQKIVELATQGLKDYDLYLKQHGHQHYIFITPTKAQLLEGAPHDKFIQSALDTHQLSYIYIKNKISPNLKPAQKLALFHDSIHLSKSGHALWADIIQQEILRN